MAFFQRGRRTWPYAANSTGRYRGTLNLGFSVGKVPVYEAVGPARTIFMDRLGPEVVAYLNNNGATLQESGTFVDLSLFMMGKSVLRTKPMLMFVSDDKNARLEAFNMIKQSGIMNAYPGFGLGNMDLRAEFENLQPLADALRTVAATSVQIAELASRMARNAKRAVRGVGPEVLGYQSTHASTPEGKQVYTDAYSPREARRLVFQDQDEAKLETRTATAGGVVSYGGRCMLHSVNHFLERMDPAPATPTAPHVSADDTPECEVTGLSDFEDDDDDDLTEITSRESRTPQSTTSRDSLSQTDDGETASIFSSASVVDQAEFLGSVNQRLEDLTLRDADTLPSPLPKELVGVGHVTISSRSHDFSLIELSKKYMSVLAEEGKSASTFNAIPLESYHEHIGESPRDTDGRPPLAEAQLEVLSLELPHLFACRGAMSSRRCMWANSIDHWCPATVAAGFAMPSPENFTDMSLQAARRQASFWSSPLAIRLLKPLLLWPQLLRA